MSNKTLVLSIALNGYQWMYKNELETHKSYAKKFGYSHQAVIRPYLSTLGVECCWLKLTLIRTALLSGYDIVIFLDADTIVNASCPALNAVIQDEKYIYMAKGYSNRFNSGVLIAKSNKKTITWLTRVIDSRFSSIQDKNKVGWGENGHVIEFSQGVSFIKELDKKWNNTFDYQLDDYIRHFNCGPMRTSIINNFFHKTVFCLSAKIVAFMSRNLSAYNQKFSEDILFRETNIILSLYPKLLYH
ncbi:MAG: lipopolysaccharide biosynthesis glycosyltransferase [Colwellia sp.]|jgi:lipopolysaccharide biosynthesis glycosyltransferase